MNGKRGGVSQVTQSGSYPGQAGALPAPAPSRTRPDSPHGNQKAPGRAARSSTPAHGAQPAQISEKDFQAQVIALAQLCGWRVFHARPALTRDGNWVTPVAGDGVGFPDLIALRGNRILVAELKAQRGYLRSAQREWIAAWQMTNAEVYVWKPSDWNEIEAVLARRSR